MAARAKRVIRRRALRIEQDAKHPLYLLTLTGEELLSIADISRISRDKAGKLIGYQRPEVRRHVRNIVEYLDSDNVLFPNSLILALPSTTVFRRVRGPKVGDSFAEAGTIEIQLPKNGDSKPAWIVDGQQRALALSKTKRKDFPVPVNAFVADEIDLQRDQFLRINSTKPLPRGLITELLPEVSSVLPSNLAARRAPAALCDVLNQDKKSPFRGLIRRASSDKAARKRAVIADTAVVKMLEESLSSPNGCLFPYRNLATGETDFAGVQAVLFTFWDAVRDVFPDAWGQPPTRSRLMHSVGLRSMARVMDRVMGSINPGGKGAAAQVRFELKRLKPVCRWTDGAYEELGGVRWNDLQNVPSHVRMLSNYLLRNYLETRRTQR